MEKKLGMAGIRAIQRLFCQFGVQISVFQPESTGIRAIQRLFLLANSATPNIQILRYSLGRWGLYEGDRRAVEDRGQ